MLCQYKDIFGKEGEGIHSYRLFDMAAVDLIGTLLLCFYISFLTRTNILIVTVSIFLLAIMMHRLFCVNTTINKKLFGVVFAS